MGLITSYSGLLAARWFLGVAEVRYVQSFPVVLVVYADFLSGGILPSCNVSLDIVVQEV